MDITQNNKLSNIIDTIKDSGKPIIIFGASTFGKRAYQYLSTHHNMKDKLLYCDNYKSGVERYTGGKIISPDELKEKYLDSFILVCVSAENVICQITNQLYKMGFSDDKIVKFHQIADAIKEETGGGISWQEAEKTFNWEINREQIKKISNWINQTDRSVIDFGAGEAYLKNFLGTNVKYIPTDYTARTEDFLIYDFNKGYFPEINADVCVLNQILYYVEDWENFLENVFNCANNKVIIGLYIGNTNFDKDYNFEHIKRNCFNSEEPIIDIAKKCGFTLAETLYLDIDAFKRQNMGLLFIRKLTE